MRGHEDRRPAFGEGAHQVQHLADELGVEGRGDLVEEQDFRVGGDRPGDRHALLLPARQAVGMSLGEAGEPDPLEQRHRAFLGILLRYLVHDARGERDVAEHGQMREEVVALEDGAQTCAHPIAIHTRVGDVLRAEEDPSVVDRFEQPEAAQQRGLARARRPDERDHVVRPERHRYPAQHFAGAERLPDVVGAQSRDGGARVRHRIAPVCSRSRRRAVYQSVTRIVGIARRTKSSPATTYGVKL